MTPIENIIKQHGKPESILLDWDNTIADSWGIIFKSLQNVFRELGMEEWSYEDVANGRENIHHSLRESFPQIFGDKWELARDIYYQSFLSCHLQEIKLLPDALETLKLLKKTGAHIAIVSNKTNKYLRAELSHLGIYHYFDSIVGAGDAEKDKPHKDPLLLALSSTKISAENYPKKVWMVGDSKTDIEAALNTNCFPVLYGSADISKFISEKNLHPSQIGKIEHHQHFQDALKGF